jgi:putative hydrolase of the HAD superfamily
VTERPALEAVVFDAGGTLVRLDFEWMSDALADLGLTITPRALRRGEVEGRRRYDASRGAPADPRHAALGLHGDTVAYFEGMLEAAGVRDGARATALERFFERHRALNLWTRPCEGARGALDALMATPLRLACVSNSDGRAERQLTDCGVREGLEFVVDSQLEGVEKPDPRIFAVALGRLGVAAARALYVGDIRSVDEDGARAAGMHFVLIDPWMDYGEGEHRVDAIAALPGWIAEHFTLPAPPSERARRRAARRT